MEYLREFVRKSLDSKGIIKFCVWSIIIGIFLVFNGSLGLLNLFFKGSTDYKDVIGAIGFGSLIASLGWFLIKKTNEAPIQTITKYLREFVNKTPFLNDKFSCVGMVIFGLFIDFLALAFFLDEPAGRDFIRFIWSMSFGSLIAYTGWFLIKKANKKSQNLSFVSPIDYNQNALELPEKNIIRAVILTKAVSGASIFMISWGVINLALYFFGNRGAVEELTVYNFCGFVISIAMLAFGLFGSVKKSMFIGYLAGISLIAVGIWNIGLVNILKHHGYQLEGLLNSKSVFLIGMIQIFWGLAEIYRFWRFGFHPKSFSPELQNDALEKMKKIIRSTVKPEVGRFKLNIRANWPIQFIKAGMYTVWLLPDKAFCLHDGLNDYFEYDRRSLSKEPFEKQVDTSITSVKITIVSRNLGLRSPNEIWLNNDALKAFNEWLRIDPLIAK